MNRDQTMKNTVRMTNSREIGRVKNGTTEPPLKISAWMREVSSSPPRMYPVSYTHLTLPTN